MAKTGNSQVTKDNFFEKKYKTLFRSIVFEEKLSQKRAASKKQDHRPGTSPRSFRQWAAEAGASAATRFDAFQSRSVWNNNADQLEQWVREEYDQMLTNEGKESNAETLTEAIRRVRAWKAEMPRINKRLKDAKIILSLLKSIKNPTTENTKNINYYEDLIPKEAKENPLYAFIKDQYRFVPGSHTLIPRLKTEKDRKLREEALEALAEADFTAHYGGDKVLKRLYDDLQQQEKIPGNDFRKARLKEIYKARFKRDLQNKIAEIVSEGDEEEKRLENALKATLEKALPEEATQPKEELLAPILAHLQYQGEDKQLVEGIVNSTLQALDPANKAILQELAEEEIAFLLLNSNIPSNTDSLEGWVKRFYKRCEQYHTNVQAVKEAIQAYKQSDALESGEDVRQVVTTTAGKEILLKLPPKAIKRLLAGYLPSENAKAATYVTGFYAYCNTSHQRYIKNKEIIVNLCVPKWARSHGKKPPSEKQKKQITEKVNEVLDAADTGRIIAEFPKNKNVISPLFPAENKLSSLEDVERHIKGFFQNCHKAHHKAHHTKILKDHLNEVFKDTAGGETPENKKVDLQIKIISTLSQDELRSLQQANAQLKTITSKLSEEELRSLQQANAQLKTITSKLSEEELRSLLKEQNLSKEQLSFFRQITTLALRVSDWSLPDKDISSQTETIASKLWEYGRRSPQQENPGSASSSEEEPGFFQEIRNIASGSLSEEQAKANIKKKVQALLWKEIDLIAPLALELSKEEPDSLQQEFGSLQRIETIASELSEYELRSLLLQWGKPLEGQDVNTYIANFYTYCSTYIFTKERIKNHYIRQCQKTPPLSKEEQKEIGKQVTEALLSEKNAALLPERALKHLLLLDSVVDKGKVVLPPLEINAVKERVQALFDTYYTNPHDHVDLLIKHKKLSVPENNEEAKAKATIIDTVWEIDKDDVLTKELSKEEMNQLLEGWKPSENNDLKEKVKEFYTYCLQYWLIKTHYIAQGKEDGKPLEKKEEEQIATEVAGVLRDKGALKLSPEALQYLLLDNRKPLSTITQNQVKAHIEPFYDSEKVEFYTTYTRKKNAILAQYIEIKKYKNDQEKLGHLFRMNELMDYVDREVIHKINDNTSDDDIITFHDRWFNIQNIASLYDNSIGKNPASKKQIAKILSNIDKEAHLLSTLSWEEINNLLRQWGPLQEGETLEANVKRFYQYCEQYVLIKGLLCKKYSNLSEQQKKEIAQEVAKALQQYKATILELPYTALYEFLEADLKNTLPNHLEGVTAYVQRVGNYSYAYSSIKDFYIALLEKNGTIIPEPEQRRIAQEVAEELLQHKAGLLEVPLTDLYEFLQDDFTKNTFLNNLGKVTTYVDYVFNNYPKYFRAKNKFNKKLNGIQQKGESLTGEQYADLWKECWEAETMKEAIAIKLGIPQKVQAFTDPEAFKEEKLAVIQAYVNAAALVVVTEGEAATAANNSLNTAAELLAEVDPETKDLAAETQEVATNLNTTLESPINQFKETAKKAAATVETTPAEAKAALEEVETKLLNYLRAENELLKAEKPEQSLKAAGLDTEQLHAFFEKNYKSAYNNVTYKRESFANSLDKFLFTRTLSSPKGREQIETKVKREFERLRLENKAKAISAAETKKMLEEAVANVQTLDSTIQRALHDEVQQKIHSLDKGLQNIIHKTLFHSFAEIRQIESAYDISEDLGRARPLEEAQFRAVTSRLTDIERAKTQSAHRFVKYIIDKVSEMSTAQANGEEPESPNKQLPEALRRFLIPVYDGTRYKALYEQSYKDLQEGNRFMAPFPKGIQYATPGLLVKKLSGEDEEEDKNQRIAYLKHIGEYNFTKQYKERGITVDDSLKQVYVLLCALKIQRSIEDGSDLEKAVTQKLEEALNEAITNPERKIKEQRRYLERQLRLPKDTLSYATTDRKATLDNFQPKKQVAEEAYTYYEELKELLADKDLLYIEKGVALYVVAVVSPFMLGYLALKGAYRTAEGAYHAAQEWNGERKGKNALKQGFRYFFTGQGLSGCRTRHKSITTPLPYSTIITLSGTAQNDPGTRNLKALTAFLEKNYTVDSTKTIAAIVQEVFEGMKEEMLGDLDNATRNYKEIIKTGEMLSELPHKQVENMLNGYFTDKDREKLGIYERSIRSKIQGFFRGEFLKLYQEKVQNQKVQKNPSATSSLTQV